MVRGSNPPNAGYELDNWKKSSTYKMLTDPHGDLYKVEDFEGLTPARDLRALA